MKEVSPMYQKALTFVIALMLLSTFVFGSVQVFAGVSPYEEYMFEEMDDMETEIGNEFHTDVLKLEGNVGGTFDGAWLEYDGFSFGTVGAVAITINYCNNSGRCAADSQLEVWIDGRSTEDGGTKVATVDLPATGSDWNTYMDAEANLDTVVTGDHDVFMVLSGSTSTATPFISNLMSFTFTKGEGEEEPTPEATETPEQTAAPTAEPTEAPTATPEETEQPATTAPATASATQDGAAGTQENDSTVMIVVVVVIVVVVIAAVIAFVVLKKKK